MNAPEIHLTAYVFGLNGPLVAQADVTIHQPRGPKHYSVSMRRDTNSVRHYPFFWRMGGVPRRYQNAVRNEVADVVDAVLSRARREGSLP